MAFILWPAFSDAASYFSHRGVAARRLQRVGTLTTVLPSAFYFFPYFFRRIFIENFVAALCTYRCRRSKHSQLFFAWRILWATKKASREAPSVFSSNAVVNTRFHHSILLPEEGGGTLVLVRCSHL
jgi:hypothetical protein